MSYSRWSYSNWYTFYHCESGQKKEDQLLALWKNNGKFFNYNYEDALNLTINDIQKIYECDLEEAEEAMLYINEFIEDVNREFK